MTPEHDATTKDGGSPPKIVVGIDGSEASLAALDWAAEQAALTSSPLEILATWDWPMTYGWAVPLPQEYDPQESVQKTLDEAADGVRARYPGYRDHHQGVAGPPRPGTRRGLQGGQAPGRRKPGARRVRRDALGIGRRTLRRARSLPGPGASWGD